MVCDARRHGWGARQPLMATNDPREAQALMMGTEVVHRAQQIHAVIQGGRLACQGTPFAHQGRQASPEGGVESFNVGGIDAASPLRLLKQGTIWAMVPCTTRRTTPTTCLRAYCLTT